MTEATRSQKFRLQDINIIESDGHTNEGSCNSSDEDDEFTSRIQRNKSANVDEGKPVHNSRLSKYAGSNMTVNSMSDDASLRLLVVSSKIKNSSVMQSAVLPHVVFFQFKYESSTVESCMGQYCRLVITLMLCGYCCMVSKS